MRPVWEEISSPVNSRGMVFPPLSPMSHHDRETPPSATKKEKPIWIKALEESV
jgi:hypothetical protein